MFTRTHVLMAGMVLWILGAKFALIARCGSDLPYWDQWDAEGAYLYQPYLEDKLTLGDFFRPHNEHRPALTRALALSLLELNDRQWDARVQLVTNAFLHSTVALLLMGFVCRHQRPLAATAIAAIVAVFFGSSVSWENTLSGFQSQFYFVLLFSLLHIGATLLAPVHSVRWWLAPVAGLAALFSMASGVLSAAAIVGAVILRAVRDRRFQRSDGYVLPSNIALIALGWWLKFDVLGHAALKAGTPVEWLSAWMHQLAWPLPTLWAAPLGLGPPLVLIVAYGIKRIDGSAAISLIAAVVWCLLQTAALAYARGAQDHGFSSRYCDTLAAAIVVNLIALVYVVSASTAARVRRVLPACAAVFAVAALCGLEIQRRAHQPTVDALPEINARRIAHVRSYLATRDPAFLTKTGWAELPYPSAPRLASLLDTPAISRLLPASVRPPLPIIPESGPNEGFSVRPVSDLPSPQSDVPVWSAPSSDKPARLLSAPFRVGHPVLTLSIAGESAGVAVRLIDEHQAVTSLAIDPPQPGWKEFRTRVEDGQNYRLELIKPAGGWLAFAAPTTNTSLSLAALDLLPSAPWLTGLGITLLLASLLPWPRNEH